MSIGIAINSISEREFTFTDKNLKSLDVKLLSLGFHLDFKVDFKKSFFTVIFTVIYNYGHIENEIQLLNFTTITRFKVKGLKKIVKFEEGNDHKFQIPDPLIETFVGAAISSTRGMLAYKLSDTILSDYYLPLIDVQKILKSYESPTNSEVW